MFTKTGATAPLHCTASGKIFLAYMDESKRDEILKGYVMTKFTDNTITTKKQLFNELKEIREQEAVETREHRGLYGFHRSSEGSILACIEIST